MFSNIVFWLEFPLFHISPLIKSISEEIGLNVTVVCENDTPEWRLDMGFPTPDFGEAKVFICPKNIERKKIINKYSDLDSVHIFHGLRHTKENFKCFKLLIDHYCSIGLYFEPIKINKTLKGALRYFYYKLLFYQYNNKIDFMLALGDMGKNQFINLGLPSYKVISFNYFIDNNYIAYTEELLQLDPEYIKILYVGQLIDRKNILMLLVSFKDIVKNNDKCFLTIVGDGNLKNILHEYVENEGIADKVFFLNYSTNQQLKEVFDKHDIFVLPSKFDGWGVVAVEAISRGLLVVLSNKCGSASIIKEQEYGIVFDSNSGQNLTEALCSIIDNSEKNLSIENKKRRVRYAKECLSAEAGKNKLYKILNNIY